MEGSGRKSKDVERPQKKTYLNTSFLTNSISITLYNDYEKGDKMYYELYVDSLFLVNFCMNLYLLLLINERTHRTATRLRLILGAAAGAILFLLPFFYNGSAGTKIILGAIPGACVMLVCTFRVRSVRAFIKLFEMLLFYSLLMGGSLLFLIRYLSRILPAFQGYLTGIFGIMGVGAVIFLLLFYRREKGEEKLCVATLVRGKKRVRVVALLDSGNSLTEPVSGKPVSVLDQEVFDKLWGEDVMYYRAIPYHSIGKEKGILKGYLLPELRLEIDGVVKVCREVYIAVGEETISSGTQDEESKVRMILNPLLIRDGDRKCQKIKIKSEVSE